MTAYASVRAVSKPAGYDRILVDGIDITFFRGIETPAPDYLLTEPYAYGPTTLQIPQVDANLETLGVGELSWIREDAPVVVQRVDDPTAETPTVLATDYRGFVVSINPDGRNLTLEVGGEFSGPASMVDKLDPLVRRVKDVGFWFANIVETLHMRPSTRSGPVTGIEITDGGGGGSLLDWANQVQAWSQDDDGVQRAIMPTVWGGNVWGFSPKDTTTRHLTLFTDDARVVAKLRRDRTARPNTWFGTGTDPDGTNWQNSRYPGIFQGPAPTFPGNMTVGDVDADTGTGDGVTVLHLKLVAMHFMGVPASYGTYSAATARAVKELQDKAGLSKTGSVNLSTWNALFDVSRTGWSTSEAFIEPLVQDTAVREFDRTANGSIAGRNPDFDASVKRVDRFIDFGPGVTKAQATRWCRAESVRLAGKDWSGTIVLNGFGGFAGDWDTSDYAFLNDPDTGVAYIMSQLDIRPGMNAWLPMFDGGTLVHIAGVQVNRRDRSVTLTVDTLARDFLELAAINARNVEAKRDIRREWKAENRPAKRSRAMVAHDEWFGILDRDIDLNGGRWNVFPMVAGQQGTVNRVKMRTVADKAKFAVSVFATHVTEKRLNRRVGNPLTVVGGESAWEKESLQDWLENNVVLYAVGDENQPCGFAPRRFKGDGGVATGAPITGRHDDRATWPYECAAGSPMIVWMAVWPDRDCTLKRGQVLYPQRDDSV